MDEIPSLGLAAILLLLILISAFFSGSETGMMSLNRYRLQHLVRSRHRGAMRAARLLERPDRLLGLILLGNNLVNFYAASIAAAIGFYLYQGVGLALAPIVFTAVVLVFAELMPKTLAAQHSERIAFFASYILQPLMRVSRPVIKVLNLVSNGLLRLFRLYRPVEKALSREELRSVVIEAGGMISQRHRGLLRNLLDLEQATMEEIMVPRSEMDTLNLDAPDSQIWEILSNCRHTRLPVWRETPENVIGILHVRRLSGLYYDSTKPLKDRIEQLLDDPYYVPEGTHLHSQLVHFQQRKERMGLVVDEYGVVQGLVTVDDILEEIVGEFTTSEQSIGEDIQRLAEASYRVGGSTSIREVNRQLGWDLPTAGAHTINGLVLEHLESIPKAGVSLRVADYMLEITRASGNTVKQVKITAANRGEDA